MMLEKAFSKLFWLLDGKPYSHAALKAIECKFTDEMAEGCDTPTVPPTSYALLRRLAVESLNLLFSTIILAKNILFGFHMILAF